MAEAENIDRERRKSWPTDSGDWAGPAWTGSAATHPANAYCGPQTERVIVERQDLCGWIAVLNTVARALEDMGNHCLAASIADIVDHIREYEED